MKFICALLNKSYPLRTLQIQPDSVKSAMTYFSPCFAGGRGAPFWDASALHGLVIDHFAFELRPDRPAPASRPTGCSSACPARSPISDFFHGTMYMTFGCSRSPVTVAVPNSSRSTAAGFRGRPAGRGPRAAGAAAGLAGLRAGRPARGGSAALRRGRGIGARFAGFRLRRAATGRLRPRPAAVAERRRRKPDARRRRIIHV